MEEKPKRQRIIYENCQGKVDEVAKLKDKITQTKEKIKVLRGEISMCQKEERKKARRKDPEQVKQMRQAQGKALAEKRKLKKQAEMA